VSGVLRLIELVRPVRDMARSLAFYTGALGFSAEAVTGFDTDLLASAWGRRPDGFTRLRLGRQSLLLALCGPAEAPPDDGATDPRFQHIAIVTRDMPAAWNRLADHHPAAISRDGPQRLPEASGGVCAVKFRDPDGHPVELIEFPPASLPQRWAVAGDGITLGIDHSAITVADADRSIDFYRSAFGLRLQARQVNQGPEQARLDGLAAPVVQVVALAPPQPSPHLELLAYRNPLPAMLPTGPRTITLWAGGADVSPHLLTDPDGHTHLVLP
jgi:catechol 2,3-dioxygenase-like lactoylglutathione lyase family enzyme